MSNAKINATPRWLCQLPVATTTTTLYGHNASHIHKYMYVFAVPTYTNTYILGEKKIWPGEGLLFIPFFFFFFFLLKHFLISLCALAFGSYSVSIPGTVSGCYSNCWTAELENSRTGNVEKQVNGIGAGWNCSSPSVWLNAKCSAINFPSWMAGNQRFECKIRWHLLAHSIALLIWIFTCLLVPVPSRVPWAS